MTIPEGDSPQTAPEYRAYPGFTREVASEVLSYLSAPRQDTAYVSDARDALVMGRAERRAPALVKLGAALGKLFRNQLLKQQGDTLSTQAVVAATVKHLELSEDDAQALIDQFISEYSQGAVYR